MGMEYLRTNNLKTAVYAFKQAQEINPNDPYIFNELAVIYQKQRNYKEARDILLNALAHCHNAVDSVKETVLLNLAGVYRKMRDWNNAIRYYERCIQINPKNAQTYFQLAYTHHISGKLERAIHFYHKSLHFKPDNNFCADMLNKCLTDAVDLPFEQVYKTL
jgi:anaphase-promoting complex subunit 6